MDSWAHLPESSGSMSFAIIERRLAASRADPPSSVEELEARLDDWEQPELPANPWARILLLCLVRHQERQRWVLEVVETRLGADPGEVGRHGAFAHPERGHGPVPGLPDWTFRFHGTGCCMTHRDGEVIDVDFVDGSADWIDPFFYLEFLRTTSRPTVHEASLVRPDPLAEFWLADTDALRRAGLIEGEHRLRVTDVGHQWAALLEAAASSRESAMPATAEAWLRLELGDPQSAASLLGDGAPASLATLADQQRTQRVALLLAALGEATAHRAGPYLQALADLDRDVAEPAVLEALRHSPPDARVSRALAIVRWWDDDQHQDAICDVIEAAAGSSPPAPHIRASGIAHLMKQGPRNLTSRTRTRLTACVNVDGGASEACLAYLAALLNQERCLSRLATALRSRIPLVREEAAAALALFGTEEALGLLRTCETPEAQTVLGLLRGLEPVTGPEPQGEVIQWRGQPKRVYRLAEIMAAQVGELTAEAFQRFASDYADIHALWTAH